MAHELTIRANGKAEMAYVGALPWHKLGNELQPGATIDQWAEAAGVDWEIMQSYPRYATARGQSADEMMRVDDKRVLFRSDTKAFLSIVSDGYKIVQPRAVLEFFRDIAEKNEGTLETAGTLFGGTRYWAMAKLAPGEAVNDARDTIAPYLLLTTSCDGTVPTTGKYVYTRAVCNNTVTAALGETSGRTVRVKHKSEFSADDMKAELGLGNRREAFASFIQRMRDLATAAASEAAIARATFELFKPGFLDSTPDAKELEAATGATKPIGRVLDLAGRGKDLIGGDHAGVKGTWYGWLNSATQYIDHEARAHNPENRMDSALWGKGDTLKSRALALATAGAAETQYQTAEGLFGELLAKRAEAPATAPVATSDGGDFSALMGKAVTVF